MENLDRYIQKIGEGIYLTDLTSKQKLENLKKVLDNYIQLCHEDIEICPFQGGIIESHRKIELFIHLIEKINEWIKQ